MSNTTNTTAVGGGPRGSMLDLLNGFVQELRSAGLPVSLTENLDAMEAVQHIPIEDRDAFKYALGATMIKNNAHWRAFETVFEVYFSLRGPEYKLAEGDESELDEFPGMKYWVEFLDDPELEKVVLARIRIAWREQGETVAEEFERILIRDTPFSHRISLIKEQR